MPGKAEYWYVLKLEGDDALKEAQKFAQAVKKELQQIQTTADVVLKARIDTSGTQKAALTDAQKLEQEYKKGLARAQREFTATASRYGAREYTASFRSMWEEGTIKPSMQAIAKIRQAEGAITDLGKVAKKMGVTTDDLVNMSGLDRAITSVQAIQRKIWGLRGLGYQLESYGRGLTMTATAMGAAAALASQKYLAFAQPLGKAARNLDLNAELTEVLDRKLTTLAGTVSMMTPQEQAEGLYLWAAATGAVVDSEEELNEVLRQSDQVQRLALLGNVEYGTAVEAVTDILSQYQLSMDQTGRVVNTLIKVAAVSKAEVSDLAQAFSFAGARADQANTSFEDTAAIFQLLSAFGLRGSRAGRGVGMLLENLIAPAATAKKELDELFTEVFGRTDVLSTAEGQFVGTAEAIGILADATQNLTEVERAEFVAKLTSQNASRALVPLLELERAARERGISAIETTSIMLRGAATDAERAQVQAFQGMMKALTGYTADSTSALDTANRQWEEYAKHVSGQAEYIKASFDASIVDIGREMTTVLLPVMQEVAGLAKDLAEYVGEHPGAASTIVWGAVITGFLGVLTTAVGKGIRLVADVKTMAMAASLNKQAKDALTAAATHVGAAELEMRAAGMHMAAANIELRAAGMEAASDTAESLAGGLGVAGGIAGGLGGTAAAGAGLASLLGPIALALAGVAALGTYIAYLQAKERSERENAAVVAASADTYAIYIQRLKDAGEEKYALTEATYDLIQAERGEGDAFSQQEAEDYAKELANARRELEEYIKTDARLNMVQGLSFEEQAQMLDVAQQYAQELAQEFVRGASEQQLLLAQQDGLVQQIVEGMNIEAQYAKIVADEIARAAYVAAVAARGEAIGGGAPEALAYEYLATGAAEAGDAILDAEDAQNELANAVKESLTPLEQFVQTAGRLDSELQYVRSGLLDVAQALSILGDTGGLDIIERELSRVEGGMTLLRARAVDLGIEEGAKKGKQSLEDLADAVESAADAGFDKFKDLAGMMSDVQILGMYDDYLAEMDTVYTQASMMDGRQAELFIQRWEDTWQAKVDGYKDAEDEITKNAEQAAKDRERFLEDAAKGFKGLVEAALKPTSVTGLDMLQTDIGAYKDKWDEAARRMRAAMEDPGGEWGFMIPEDVKAQGLDAAKAWGANWIDQFYAGMHPDQIDWPAFITSFKQSLEREAAKGRLVDIAIGKLAEEGITATSDEVLAALGLQSPLQQMFLGGLSPTDASKGLSSTMSSVVSGISIEQGTFDTAAGTVSTAFVGSLNTNLAESNLPVTLNAIWIKQMSDAPDPIIAVGRVAGGLFWQGFEESAEGSTFADYISGLVLAEILEAMGGT